MNTNLASVLVVHPSLGIGGAEKIIAFVANALCQNYKVRMLLLQEQKQTLSLDSRISIKTTPCYIAQPLFGKRFFPVFKSIKQMGQSIASEIASYHPQLVVCFDLRVLLALYLAGDFKKMNVLFSERADPFANRWYWAIILRFLYRRVKHLVFQTQEAADFYGTAFENKRTIIPNPAFPRTQLVTMPAEKAPVILAAGRFQYRKGISTYLLRYRR